MPINDTSIYFIIAILGLAYPLLLTVITRLDDKYKSVIIVQLFRRCREFQAFQVLLIIVIGVTALQVIWIINWRSMPPANPANMFYDWSEVTLALVAGALLVSFFLLTRRIFKFYIPQSLVSFLRQKKDKEDQLIFKSLTVLLFFGMEVQDDEIVATLRAHFSQLFLNCRTAAADNAVQYPVAYYEMVYDTIYRSSKSDYWKVRNMGFTAASGRWLIGSLEYSHIDKLTYAWLWNNLQLMLRLDREDFIEEFWHNSHQFFRTALSPLPWQHDNDRPGEVLNQPAVDERERERQYFFEFHTALGGMLLYEKRYKLIKRLFDHTTSIPVRYELLPLSMNTVLELFFRFWNHDGMFYIGRYQFPDQGGIAGEWISREYIARYTALLFIRQYFLVSQYYGYEPVSPLQGPNNQGDRTVWIQQLPVFKKLVEEVQEDTALLNVLGYQRITPEWSQQHTKDMPDAILDKLIANIKSAYAAAEVEQRAEEDKKRVFRQTSAKIIDARISSYENVLNEQPIVAHYESSRIKGGFVLYHKAAFSSEQGVTYMSYDSFFAESIAAEFTRQITELFQEKALRSYLFRAPQFFEAIDKLHLKPNEHLLLNFGISLDFVIRKYGIDRLTEKSYKGIPIINLNYVDRSAMRSSFIIIRKTDLPSFLFHQPDDKSVERFHLDRVSNTSELHASVIDLNQEQHLKTLFPNEKPDVLDTSVILVLELNVEVRWKIKAKMLRLSMYSDFYQQGAVNELSEVKRF